MSAATRGGGPILSGAMSHGLPASRGTDRVRVETGPIGLNLLGASPLIARGLAQCLAGCDPAFELRVVAAAGAGRNLAAQQGGLWVVDGISRPATAESQVAALVTAEPHVLAVVLVGGYGAGEATRFLRAGACDCLPVNLPPRQMRGRLATIRAGGVGYPAETGGARPQGVVGRRESEVLGLLVSGVRSHEIAIMLGMRASTVASHLQNIRAKLGARSTAELVAIAARLGLVV